MEVRTDSERSTSERSTAQLIGDLTEEIRTLVRQELALARAELREETSRIVAAVVAALAGTAALAVGGLWILIALTRAIAEAFKWPLGGAYVLVGAVLACVGAVCVALAWDRGREIRILPKTRETLSAR